MKATLVSILAAVAFAGCGGDGGESSADAGIGQDRDAAQDATPSAVCGDSSLESSEGCDDGNSEAGDGCSETCEVEDDYACPAAGEDCVLVVVCGNAVIEGDESCDDQNTADDDGCSSDCQLEPGWDCPTAGVACVSSQCGDGVVAGFEICDDGNNDESDGCDANCALEEGFHCPTPNVLCAATTCGDGLVQGTEECDDQNGVVGDGCDPLCKQEPQCSNGICLAVCGDGVVFAPEECDDGNTLSGDGCNASCMIESGFTCQEVVQPDPPEVELSVTIRDFIAACDVDSGDRRLADDEGGAVAPFGHRDFQCFNGGLETGMVETALDVDGKPVRVANGQTTSDASFAQWYRSDNDYNRTVASVLTLPGIGGGAFQLDSDSLYPATGQGFDVEDCNGSPCESVHPDGNGAGDQNFHFTTETRWWFEYAGDEVLAFSGDDDVWVFINDVLAVDIGGVHGRQNAQVDLSDAGVATNLGLTVGGIYEAVVFHAERHTTRSQYRLTLTNFNQAPSECDDDCGDGVVSSLEVCDQGANNGSGDGSEYGGCAADCTFEPFCGDGVVDSEHGETCDDGLNLGGTASDCAPGCTSTGASCGDGVVQTSAGEQCDDGNMASGDGCSASCTIEID